MPIKLTPKVSVPTPIAPPSVATVAEQAAALNLEIPENALPEENPLLPSRYLERDLPSPLKEKLETIDNIISKGGKIPLDSLRLACQSVFQCIKANEDLLKRLEPEDFQLVVQSYIKVADKKTQEILEPKEKKKKKSDVKAILAQPKLELDEEEF